MGELMVPAIATVLQIDDVEEMFANQFRRNKLYTKTLCLTLWENQHEIREVYARYDRRPFFVGSRGVLESKRTSTLVNRVDLVWCAILNWTRSLFFMQVLDQGHAAGDS